MRIRAEARKKRRTKRGMSMGNVARGGINLTKKCCLLIVWACDRARRDVSAFADQITAAVRPHLR